MMTFPTAIVVSDGDIQINGLWFSTRDYTPPHRQRAISYQDVPVSTAAGIRMRRRVVDFGPTLGLWKPFTVICMASDDYDPISQPYRGQYLYERLRVFYDEFVGEPLRLREKVTEREFWFVFAQNGFEETVIQPRAVDFDPATGDEIDLGPEYLVQLTLVEVEP